MGSNVIRKLLLDDWEFSKSRSRQGYSRRCAWMWSWPRSSLPERLSF